MSEKWITPGDPYPEELEELDPLLSRANQLAHEVAKASIEHRAAYIENKGASTTSKRLWKAAQVLGRLLDEYESFVSRLGEGE
jgi:hypothetical protein